jgi:hypothetical protein
MMAQMKVPRVAFTDFPVGYQCGRPHDREMQIAILRQTLALLPAAKVPGEIVDLPFSWGEPFSVPSYWQTIREMVKEEGIPFPEWTPKKK